MRAEKFTKPVQGTLPNSNRCVLPESAVRLLRSCLGFGLVANEQDVRVSLAEHRVAAGHEADLDTWMIQFEKQCLMDLEWRIIRQAHNYAERGLARELVQLDQNWSEHMAGSPDAEASRQVGRRQLNRLRPMPDQRIVLRYLDAIEHGGAQGWHPVVYGVFLAIYNIPLRQGLMQYSRHIVWAVAAGLAELCQWSPQKQEKWAEQSCRRLEEGLRIHLPATWAVLESAIPDSGAKRPGIPAS